jgi:hypothetical protein
MTNFLVKQIIITEEDYAIETKSEEEAIRIMQLNDPSTMSLMGRTIYAPEIIIVRKMAEPSNNGKSETEVIIIHESTRPIVTSA